jgi:hypothetical protein
VRDYCKLKGIRYFGYGVIKDEYLEIFGTGGQDRNAFFQTGDMLEEDADFGELLSCKKHASD